MASLQESLNKFKQQQEMCQSTLTSFKAGSKSTSKVTPYSTPANSKSPVPAIKFSNDTERLQHINSIRKAPAGAQIKRVIQLLLETRQAFTSEQINEVCYVDVNANKTVFDSLKNNQKVYYDGRLFSYKSKHDVKDKNQLLVLIRKFPEGTAVIDLKDAYPTGMDDLQDVAYPNDPRACITVDDDLKQLFRGVELPNDMIDIEKDLQKNGMKPATNTTKRRAMAQVHGIAPKSKQKKKKHEISKRTKLTNAHLPELFKQLGS